MEKSEIITVDKQLLRNNIKSFIEIQYGETIDESMADYIDKLIQMTESGKEY